MNIEVDGRNWVRIPVKTHLITCDDDIAEVIQRYAASVQQPGDWISVSEKVVAVTQGRAIRESEMKIGLLARILWRFVAKVPYGTGLRRPSSMQCAINECGSLRILFAAAVGAFGKLIGRKGDFYRIAGMQAATIDAAGTSPLQPDCVIMGPKDPAQVAERVKAASGLEAAVMDINDIGGSWCLGATPGIDKELIQKIMKDNPCGQTDEQTPFALIRQAPDEPDA
ncbi:hypothetical protein JXA32_17070 [Candidatus Sumerlaeota bacterium]|nr:hypothetical protein [Candidatus Sumerlaeota bacterium]